MSGPVLHRLADDELRAAIERLWGALPAEVAADPEFLARTLDCFRADLEALETYRHRPGEPLDCPVTAVGGADDRHTPAMDEWRHQTTGAFDRQVFPGGHFYFRGRCDVPRLLSELITGVPRE